jgi:2-polyprenyl-6-methoxyphenol hydroxylase-like FAD-dependent oxidoreductase
MTPDSATGAAVNKPRTDDRADVVIVGAGGGGAVLGLALAQQGVSVRVLEQSPAPPTGLRGEILQPNGQAVMARLGLLDKLPPSSVREVRHFHFLRSGGERLCSIDYGMLPPPYNRALVTMPNAAHHAILDALEAAAPGSLQYGATVKGLIRDGGAVAGVDAEQDGRRFAISSKITVGADGAFSNVRQALGIPAALHLYRDAYLIAMLDGAPGVLPDARYYVGRGTIFGLFPAAGRKIYVFYMIRANSMPEIKAAGLESLRRQWRLIAPDLGDVFETLTEWTQTAYMPTGRVRTGSWVTDRAALIGDAAHAMNPHASQGRMQAMMDAMTLAEVIPRCLASGDCSAAALNPFERARRPHVEMLQRLADEQVVFWNSGNPVLGYLRDRVFRTLDRNRRLRYQVLATTAGLRAAAPFTLQDRFIAAGLLPDSHANELPCEAGRPVSEH